MTEEKPKCPRCGYGTFRTREDNISVCVKCRFEFPNPYEEEPQSLKEEK